MSSNESTQHIPNLIIQYCNHTNHRPMVDNWCYRIRLTGMYVSHPFPFSREKPQAGVGDLEAMLVWSFHSYQFYLQEYKLSLYILCTMLNHNHEFLSSVSPRESQLSKDVQRFTKQWANYKRAEHCWIDLPNISKSHQRLGVV